MELLLGSLDTDVISQAIDDFNSSRTLEETGVTIAETIAVSVFIKESSYEKLKKLYPPISDEYLFQKFAIHLGESS